MLCLISTAWAKEGNFWRIIGGIPSVSKGFFYFFFLVFCTLSELLLYYRSWWLKESWSLLVAFSSSLTWWHTALSGKGQFCRVAALFCVDIMTVDVDTSDQSARRSHWVSGGQWCRSEKDAFVASDFLSSRLRNWRIFLCFSNFFFPRQPPNCGGHVILKWPGPSVLVQIIPFKLCVLMQNFIEIFT